MIASAAESGTTSTKAIRERNRRARRRLVAIERTNEQLDVFGVLLATHGLMDLDLPDHDQRYSAIRRQHAATIVDLVTDAIEV